MTINTASGYERTQDDAQAVSETLKLRAQGLTYREIGERLGIDPSTAQRRVKRGLAETICESVDEMRRLEGERLDALQLALWPKAMEGNAQAVRTILTISERRSKLYGLDQPHQVTIEQWSMESIDAEVARLTRLLADNPDY
jgi:hypothetical protein